VALIERTSVDPAAVDHVIFGCVDAVGPQAGDIARACWLTAGLPESVPGTTVDQTCASSQQAIHLAAQAVMSGVASIVVAGGVQNMSAVDVGIARRTTGERTDGWQASGWTERYPDAVFNHSLAADGVARLWGISRADMEDWAVESHQRALAATRQGLFRDEVVTLGPLRDDECPREPNIDKMRSLAPLRADGLHTAALAGQLSDASAAVLIVGEEAVAHFGLRPRARIHSMLVRGGDPSLLLTAHIETTKEALRRAGLIPDDIDRVEVHEPFAAVVLAWQRELSFDIAKMNINGGALALGHPVGASGARLLTSLLNELERSGGRYGMQVMVADGQGVVTIVERL
jgi:acetyl-CoA C-acetyltransferase